MNLRSLTSISSLLPQAAALTLGLFLIVPQGKADNLVKNGNFEDLLVPGLAAQFGNKYPTQQVTDWSVDGYSFVYTPGSADTTGAIGQYGKLTLWGPANGSSNGLTAISPAGGNFLALDGAFEQSPLTQTIYGLTLGKTAELTFYWAGAQQHNYNGATTEQFEVSLGSEHEYTAVLDNASHGFTGWRQETMNFTPTSTTEVLSFFAIGTPGGEPPFSLLDGVVLNDAPEPASIGLFLVSASAGLVYFRRRNAKKA